EGDRVAEGRPSRQQAERIHGVDGRVVRAAMADEPDDRRRALCQRAAHRLELSRVLQQPQQGGRLLADLGQEQPARITHCATSAARARAFTKTLSSAVRRPCASAPARTAASPRLETSTRGGYSSDSASIPRTGSSSRSPFAPTPPPRTTNA